MPETTPSRTRSLSAVFQKRRNSSLRKRPQCSALRTLPMRLWKQPFRRLQIVLKRCLTVRHSGCCPTTSTNAASRWRERCVRSSTIFVWRRRLVQKEINRREPSASNVSENLSLRMRAWKTPYASTLILRHSQRLLRLMWTRYAPNFRNSLQRWAISLTFIARLSRSISQLRRRGCGTSKMSTAS